MRQAINYAINQVGIVDKINKGFGTPAGQLSPKGYAGYNEALKPQYDPGQGQGADEGSRLRRASR